MSPKCPSPNTRACSMQPEAMATVLLYPDSPALKLLLRSLLRGVSVPPAPPVPAQQAGVYRNMLSCLVLVLQGLGPSFWLHPQPPSSSRSSGGSGSRVQPQEEVEGAREPDALAASLMRAMNCAQDEATQKVRDGLMTWQGGLKRC